MWALGLDVLPSRLSLGVNLLLLRNNIYTPKNMKSAKRIVIKVAITILDGVICSGRFTVPAEELVLLPSTMIEVDDAGVMVIVVGTYDDFVIVIKVSDRGV